MPYPPRLEQVVEDPDAGIPDLTRDICRMLLEQIAHLTDRLIADGRYQNASKALRAGLRLLGRDEAELTALRTRLVSGLGEARTRAGLPKAPVRTQSPSLCGDPFPLWGRVSRPNGVLAAHADDERLSWPEKELVRMPDRGPSGGAREPMIVGVRAVGKVDPGSGWKPADQD